LLAAGVAFPNPFGVFPRHGWYSDVIGAMAAVAGITAVLALVSVFVRRRGASAELRQQQAWLAYVGALTAVFAVLMTGYSLVTGGNSWVGSVLFVLTFGTPIFGIPLACAVAVLRYRLYDLDIVVKKTVVAAVVAAVFTAVYVLVVVVVGAATGQPGGNPLTFVAAVLAAVLLQPVRTQAGRLADRLVYGTRATPYEVLSEFSEHMAGTYSAEDVLPRMARMLAEATGAQRAEVWLRTSGREHLEAAWPSPDGQAPAEPGLTPQMTLAAPASAGPGPAAPAPVTAAPAGAGTPGPQAAEPAEDGTGEGRARAFVVEHQGERLGALRITSSPREPLTPAGERLVRDVAAQAGLVLRNVALIEDLRASRQRLVAAGSGVQGMADRLAALAEPFASRRPSVTAPRSPGGCRPRRDYPRGGGSPPGSLPAGGGSQRRNSTWPNVTRSPARTRKPEPTFHPFARVPLVEPRSASIQSSPTRRNSAWRHDTVMSGSARSE
jgi:hypothetical protein